ncbi:MAG TPA: alpha/beta hydrolase [Acidimicrobiia bacterium]|nr:alpha/beta hydrolase [Acidimicrobiia bacterium]
MSWRPLVTIGALVAVVTVGLPVSAGAATKPAGSLTWKGCGDGLQCTTLSVPVDWSKPTGSQVALAVARLPAKDQQHRLGSLVINYGGPGDPGTESLRLGASSMPAAIRERFDLVSFDPRGTGASRPIACVDDATYDRVLAQDPTPDTPDQLLTFYNGTNGPIDLVQACVDKQGSWLAQVGTRNTVRDLEALRAAIGEPKLTFLGYSYGTVMGALYAEMYPSRVRAMVLDGAVNLSATAASELHDNAVGFEQALDAFLADCAAKTSCEFHEHGNPQAALTQLRQQFENGTQLPVGDGRQAGATLFYLALASGLYDRANGWPFLAKALAGAVHGSGSGLATLADSISGRGTDGHFNDLQEALATIRCDDRHDPLMSFTDFQALYSQYSQAFPIFGAFLASSPLGCDPRLPAPPPSEQVGDVRVTAAPPILIVGTTGDPATPYAGALDLQQRLRASRVLTLVSTEHAGYGKGIGCIDHPVDRYLLTQVLPRVGQRCKA